MPCFPIKWQGIPHNEISLPQGKWRFPEEEHFGAMMFQLVNTANEMGMPINEFLELPDWAKAMHVAHSNIKHKIDQVNQQERLDQMNRKS